MNIPLQKEVEHRIELLKEMLAEPYIRNYSPAWIETLTTTIDFLTTYLSIEEPKEKTSEINQDLYDYYNEGLRDAKLSNSCL